MKKPIFIEIDENFALRRSVIISIGIYESGFSKYLLIKYAEGKEIKKYATKSYAKDVCEYEYKRILEALKW